VDLVTSLAGTQAVVDVFPAILKSHIEPAKVLPRATAKKRTRRRNHLEATGDERGRMVGGEPGIDMVRAGVEADGDSRMLNRVVRKEELGPDDGRGWELDGIVHERKEPARGRNGVVVQQDHEFAGRRRDSGVAGSGETERGLVANDENVIAVFRQQRWSHVGRAVIDDDKLPIYPVVRFGEERIEALPGERRLVVHRDDDRSGQPALNVHWRRLR
jgi:hypothetical protein